MLVPKKYEIITARFAKIKSQGSQRPKILTITFAIYRNLCELCVKRYFLDSLIVTIVNVMV